MQDSQKWINVLEEVKRKGKRKLLIRKSLSSALALLVFVIGIWQLLFVSVNNNSSLDREAEIAYYSQDSVIYDRDFGYIAVSLDE